MTEGIVDFRLPAYFGVFFPFTHTIVKFSAIKSWKKEELFMVGDSGNKDDNDVTAGDIITVCQPTQQKRALPGLPRCLGRSSREKREPKD